MPEHPLSVTQAAALLRVSPETIRRWVRSGVVPDRRPPGARKILLFTSDLIRSPGTKEAA